MFEYFPGFLSTPQGVLKWWKTRNFNVFTIFGQFLTIFSNLTMKSYPKARLLLKNDWKLKRKSRRPQRVTPVIITPGGQTPIFSPKSHFLLKLHARNIELIENYYFMPCFVSPHINEYKNAFKHFSGFFQYTPMVSNTHSFIKLPQILRVCVCTNTFQLWIIW